MVKKRLFLTLISTFLIVIISVGISFAWYTNKKVDDFESPDVTGYSTAAYYAGGDGSKEKPFLIKNSRHLYNFAWLQYLGTYNKINNGSVKQYYFEVIDDIDCEGLVLPPIGTIDNPFLGNFNGGNHLIENLTITNNYNDLVKKPSSINSTTKFKGCEIIGFFGVVGKYADYVDVNISGEVNSVYNFTIDGVKVNNACSNTLAGLIAGFVNGNISNVGVHYGKINLQSTTSKISSFKNISSYTLIGDYDEDLVSWEDKPNHSNSGAAQDFGGTIDFINMHKRMELIGANNWTFPTVSIDVPNESNNQILDSVITNRGYMPLVISNDITQSYYSKNTEEKTLDSNIGYFVGSSAYLEKVNAIYEHNDPDDSTDDVYGVIDEKFVTRDASNKVTDVQIYKAENKTNIEVTNTIDSGIKDTLVSMLNDGYLYGVRFTAQISNNQSVAIKNAIVDNGVVDSINVPNSSIWFKPLTSGTAKIVSYQANSTRSLSFYEITRNDNNSFSTSFLKEEMYMNGNEWKQTFYYFEVEVEAGHEYAIGSANGSDTAHFVYLDVGQNSGPPIVEDPELKESVIDDIDFVYLESGNSFSSTTVDYSNVFFQISGTTTSLIELFFRRNNDADDNYAGSEGIVLFYPRSESGGEWVTTSSGKTSSGVSLDWSYAGTKGLSGTSSKYTDPTECEVLSGSKLSGGIENTNTGVNTKCTITYYYRKRNDDDSYESVLITKGTVTKGYAISKPTFEIPGYQILKWYTDEAMTTEYDFSSGIEDNLVLYASVTEVETFNVTFVDGTEEIQSVIVNSGSTAKFNTPRKENYVFSHWVDEQGTEVDLETLIITSDTVLTAVWKDAYDIKFVYNVDGEDVIIDTVEIEQGDKVSMPDEDPKLSGYNFGGWYTSTEYTSEFDFANIPTSDTTIYAKFIAIQYYDVIFGYIEDEELVTIIQNKVEEQTSVDEPIEPTRVGYVFGGWYADETCTIEFDFSSKITANTTVYAKWQASLVVTFEYEDGTFIDSVSVLSGNKITATETSISKTGYRFDGNWYAMASDGSVSETPFDFESAVETNMTLVPGWIKTYEVTVVYGNGTTDSTEVVDTGTVYSKPTDPIRTGYKFNGWYTLSEDGTKTTYDFSTAITEDITIYADWVELVNVTLVIGDTTDVIYGEIGDTVTLPSTNDDYYIISWTDGETTYQPGDQVTVTATTTYTADVVVKYTITVNDGITTTTLVSDVNYKVILPDAPESTTTAIFAGWTDSETTYDAGVEIIVNSNMTITATWTYATSVTFDANGGTIGAESTVVVNDIQSTAGRVDTSKIPADPTRAEYTFQGWYIDSSCTIELDTTKPITVSTIYAGWKKTIIETVTITVYVNSNESNRNERMIESSITIAQARNTVDVYNAIYEALCEYYDDNPSSYNFYNYELVTVYEHDSWFAKAISDAYLTTNNGLVSGEWYAVYVREKQGESYTVEFNSNGGSTVANQTVLEGRTASKPADPTRDGYIFLGWYSDSALTTEYDFSTPISGNITLFAKWIEQKTVTINYVEGGNTTTENIKVAVGESITLPSDVTNEYYIISITDGETQYNEGSSLEVEDDITLTINKVTIYQVTIDYGNGTTETVYTNENYLVSPTNQNPTNGTAVLVGWYVDDIEFDFATDEIKSSDIIITARWEYNVTVTFSVNGSTYYTETTTTGYVTLPEAPSEEGYIFIGWYNGSEKIDGTTIFSVDTTVTAEWQEIYTITFVYNDNSTSDFVLETNENCMITNFPEDPTREGYIFSGWYADGEQVTPSTSFDASTIVEAQWVETHTITFDANGGTHTASTTTFTTNVDGKLSTLPSNPTKDGYSFVEWNTVADASGDTVTTGTVFESDTTVYAIWEEASYEMYIRIYVYDSSTDTYSEDPIITLKLMYGDTIKFTDEEMALMKQYDANDDYVNFYSRVNGNGYDWVFGGTNTAQSWMGEEYREIYIKIT